jgi:MerR family transcriptional regulator, copper efflux regulator
MQSMKKIVDYLKIKNAADFLGVTPNTLRNWEKEKKITVYRNPQNLYRLYKKEDLEALLSSIKPVK